MRILLALLLVLAACTPSPAAVRLRMIASAELADLGPVLDELRKATGVELAVDYRGTVEATGAVGEYDLAWLSTNRFLRMRAAEPLLATSIMLSPVVLGVKADKRGVLGAGPSWADIADRAALGELRFGMGDPRVSGGGMAALVGVATAASGTGAALRIEDVSCDRIQGFLSGRAFTATDVIGEYVRRQSEVDAVIAHESELLALNASGRASVEIVYPRDGIVVSDYPLTLVKPEHRDAYDRVVEWLLTPDAQRQIMERTWRRPVEPSVKRPSQFARLGTALYFPDTQAVIDRLLAFHDQAGNGRQVIFVLDYSTSMRGARIAGLRDAFTALNGFDSFFAGETVTIVRFAGEVLEERSVTVAGRGDLDVLRALVASEDLRDNTAIWSAVDHGLKLARPGATVVLMTDGENNAGMSADEFFLVGRGETPVYPIRFGEADPEELDRLAQASGGRVVDASATSLLAAVKEIRGCR